MDSSFNLFNDPTTQGMEYALNSLSLRQSVLADNIANAQTPGYQAQDVSFQNQLSSILDGQQSGVSPTDTGDVVDSADITPRIDGNTVGMESEMGKISETNILYDALAQLTADRMGLIKTAITG